MIGVIICGVGILMLLSFMIHKSTEREEGFWRWFNKFTDIRPIKDWRFSDLHFVLTAGHIIIALILSFFI